MYVEYIDISRKALESFHCISVDVTSTSTLGISTLNWVKDTSVRCFQGVHSGVVGALSVPLLILASGGLPLGVFLFAKQSQIDSSNRWLSKKLWFWYKVIRVGTQFV